MNWFGPILTLMVESFSDLTFTWHWSPPQPWWPPSSSSTCCWQWRWAAIAAEVRHCCLVWSWFVSGKKIKDSNQKCLGQTISKMNIGQKADKCLKMRGSDKWKYTFAVLIQPEKCFRRQRGGWSRRCEQNRGIANYLVVSYSGEFKVLSTTS